MLTRLRDRPGSRGERGQVVVLFALLLPVFLSLGAIVISIGNWYTHGKHLQTKADAAAFAGGSVWGFPCGPDIDLKIEGQARTYAGPHMKADGTPYTGLAFNNQVGGVTGSQIHVVLNGSAWYDDDSNPFPAERDDPANASICDAKILDVKLTEDNSFPLFRYLPFFPDIKRKARVEIDQIESLSGLLPIAVRIPRPLSAAAVFYNENSGLILDVRYMCESTNVGGLPAGLGGWTTLDPTNNQGPMGTSLCPSWTPPFNVGARTGVVVATSFRPACDIANPPPGPCLQDSGWVGQQVNNFCRQASGSVQCWDATGTGSTQNVQSGIQLIRGYPNAGGPPPPLRSVYLDGAPANCGAYFNSVSTTCTARLNVALDLSAYTGQYPNPSPPPLQITAPLIASDVQVRYRLVRGDGSSSCNYGVNCNVLANSAGASGAMVGFSTGGNASSPDLPLTPDSQGNAVALEIRLRNASGGGLPAACGNANFNANCRWFYTGSATNASTAPTDVAILADPVQRSFSGSVDRTGPLRWTRLTADTDNPCDSVPNLGLSETAEAASVPAGGHCFYFEMGLQGGIARDQDEPSIAFNLGSTGSQRALIDCDDVAGSNLMTEIQNGCPRYATHQFTYTPYCPNVNSITGLLAPHPAPWDASNGWPPAGGTRCVITQTGASNQIIPGFNQRFFGVQNNPTCPADNAQGYVPGRNYWHDNNNMYNGATFAETIPTLVHGNNLRTDDPRLVTLFFTPYDSFSSGGNEPFPIVGFGAFYVTGYGRTTGGGGSWQGGAPEDPCTGGNVGNPLDGLPYGWGNEPPPDLNLGANQTWVWGHFVNPVLLTSNATPTATLCNPGASFQPCVAVLVE